MTLARSGDMINAMPHEKSYTLMHMTLARSFMLQTSSRDMRIADPTPVQQSFCVHLHLHWEGNETITVTFFLTNETSGKYIPLKLHCHPSSMTTKTDQTWFCSKTAVPVLCVALPPALSQQVLHWHSGSSALLHALPELTIRALPLTCLRQIMMITTHSHIYTHTAIMFSSSSSSSSLLHCGVPFHRHATA